MIIMSSKKVDITPDKSLLKKLGLVGYRTEQAVSELIDNSIDARLDNTENINVHLNFNLGTIIVEDNGTGMDLDGLRNALTIAYETKGDEKLGRFGLGLKSACSSLGKAFTLSTATRDSKSIFTVEYDEDMWLQNQSLNWTNFEINEEINNFNWHGTKIIIKKIKVPLYPNQLLNFRRRFGIRYGPYIESKQIRIKVNSRDCQPSKPDLVENSKRSIDITTPSGDRLVGWIGILTHRSIKGDYGIHLYRNKRLISAFNKFGIHHHPSVAKIVGEISLDHVPVNFHKTGFLVESPEYGDASYYFMKHPAVKETLHNASSFGGNVPSIQSVLDFNQSETLELLDTKMSSEKARQLLQKADRFVQKKDGTEFIFEFDDSASCRIEHTDNRVRVNIGRNSRAFGLFKNPLFFIGLIRIESELIAKDPSYYRFVEHRNKMLDEFITDRIREPQNQSKTKRDIIPLSQYTIQRDLIDLHDYLGEIFEHNFQFTGISTLAPFLQNAYSKVVYSINTITGAGQSLLDTISDHTEEFTVLLNPKVLEFNVLFENTTLNKFIAIREYEETTTHTWAGPEKAWLDLYFDVTRDILPLYHDELIFILDELLCKGLVTAAKIRSLAKRRKIQDEVDKYLPRE